MPIKKNHLRDITFDFKDYEKRCFVKNLCEAVLYANEKCNYFITSYREFNFYRKLGFPIFVVENLIWGKDFIYIKKSSGEKSIKYSKDYLERSKAFEEFRGAA